VFVFWSFSLFCFNVFTGGKGKFFTTEICQTCAKLRNACQSCVLDLVYKLPVQLRDQISNISSTPVMMNEVHREYFADQAERKIAEGAAQQFNKALPMPKMVGVARTLTPYFRELGMEGTAMTSAGDTDPNNTSLYVGGIAPNTTQADVQACLESYGQITRISLVPKSHCAFVDFASRAGAEAAYVGCGGTIVVGAAKLVCSVNWSKSKRRAHHDDNDEGKIGSSVPPPPGVAPPQRSGQPLGIPASAVYYPSASGKHDGSAPVKR
jgi:pre-mRNA-splicing factor RBM22/SLT11